MEIIVIKIILLVLWAIMAIVFFLPYKRLISEYTYGLGRLFIYIIIIIAAPIVNANTILFTIIDQILPEGWQNGDDEFYNDQKEDDNEQ